MVHSTIHHRTEWNSRTQEHKLGLQNCLPTKVVEGTPTNDGSDRNQVSSTSVVLVLMHMVNVYDTDTLNEIVLSLKASRHTNPKGDRELGCVLLSGSTSEGALEETPGEISEGPSERISQGTSGKISSESLP